MTSVMTRCFGKPRHDLIDLLTSTVGCLMAQRIDEAHKASGGAPKAAIRQAARRMLALIQQMDRAQLEACHAELNAFFRQMPFSEAVPVVIGIEKKWPHYIETLPDANQRLDFIRKGGEYARLFDAQKIEHLLACLHDSGVRPQ